MKVSPIAQGGSPGQDLAGVSVGKTAVPEKLAAAKAIAAGETPVVEEEKKTGDPQVDRINARKIKMKTNASPERYTEEAAAAVEPVAEPSIVPDSTVQAEATIEDTKPLSPQFAALAKQRRAQQQKEAQLAEREAALDMSKYISKEDLKAKTLSVLQAEGALTPDFYNSLTETLMGNQPDPEIQALKAEIKALKEGVDKTFVDRDTQAEEAVLSEILTDVEGLAKEGDAYEMIRGLDGYDRVLRLIHDGYKAGKGVMDTTEAMDIVEKQLLDEAIKRTSMNKVRSQLQAAQPPQVQQQPKQQMRTLTNRDGASVPMSAKARAIAAFHGTLRK